MEGITTVTGLTLYRIKHTNSGYYFCPARKVKGWTASPKYVKSNLSKSGKVYFTRPNLETMAKALDGEFYTHFDTVTGPHPSIREEEHTGNTLTPFILDEWEIEEIRRR